MTRSSEVTQEVSGVYLKVKDGCNKKVLGSRDSRKPAASLREEALDCESGNNVSDRAALSSNELCHSGQDKHSGTEYQSCQRE